MPTTSHSPPINLLPEDILRLIFESTYRSRSERWPNQRPSVTTFILSHVCMAWRSIVMDFAILWSDIFWGASKDFNLLDTLLRRSKGASINLDLRLDEPSEAGRRLIDTLLPHIARCRALTLYGHSSGLSLFLRCISGMATPSNLSNGTIPLHDEEYIHAARLEYLNLSVDSARNLPLNELGSLFGGFTPRLREIHLGKVIGFSVLRHSLASITTLEVEMWMADIEQCTSLVRLTYRGGTMSFIRPLDLPSLREFTWAAWGTPGAPQDLLSSRTWAALTDITLHMNNGTPILRILSQTPNIRRAALYITAHSGRSWRPIEVDLPNLLDLNLIHLFHQLPPSPFLDQLKAPRLRRLSVGHDVEVSHTYAGQVWRFIHLRQPPLRQLLLSGYDLTPDAPSALGDAPIFSIVRDALPHLRILHIHPCAQEMQGLLSQMLSTRGGAFYESEDDAMMKGGLNLIELAE